MVRQSIVSTSFNRNVIKSANHSGILDLDNLNTPRLDNPFSPANEGNSDLSTLQLNKLSTSDA
jgi:hypothetical protein